MSHLDHLRAFEQVVRTGNFTEAAKRLGISRPAVSKSISQLEMQLGTRLFNRTTRSLHLTSEGSLFFEKVCGALVQLDEATELLRESKLGPTGRIRASSVCLFGKYYMVPVLGAFLAKYPQVTLEIAFDDAVPDFVRQGLDVGVVRGSENESSLISRRLYKLQLCLVASPAYLSQHGIPRTPTELRSHKTISVRLPTTGRLPLWHFERMGDDDDRQGRAQTEVVEPNGPFVVAGNFDAVVDCALAGIGITISHLGAVASHLAAGDLKILLPDYRFFSGPKASEEIHIQYPHREYLPLKVRVFVDFLVEHFREREARERDRAVLAQYAVDA